MDREAAPPKPQEPAPQYIPGMGYVRPAPPNPNHVPGYAAAALKAFLTEGVARPANR